MPLIIQEFKFSLLGFPDPWRWQYSRKFETSGTTKPATRHRIPEEMGPLQVCTNLKSQNSSPSRDTNVAELSVMARIESGSFHRAKSLHMKLGYWNVAFE